MATTIWIDRATHDRLADAKRKMGAASLGAVIRQLLDGPQETAAAIYRRRKRWVDAACRKHGVRRLVAFGSRARGDARVGSDLDVAVDLPPDLGLGIVQAFQDIARAFGCPTDVIERPTHRTHRPRLLAEIERDGVVLYER